MNKKELMELIENCKIGDEFYNLKIEGLNNTEISAVLQELAREKELQFYVEFIDGSFKYTVAEPSKKFLNREGQWKIELSKRATEYIDNLKK